MTPSTMGHLLDREDSGISDTLSKRQWEEEKSGGGGADSQGQGDTEKEDPYIVMQSCATK